jgi:hypothetical protein
VANDFNLEEFKLKDPVSNINDGLKEPVKDSTPGFFFVFKKSIRSYVGRIYASIFISMGYWKH